MRCIFAALLVVVLLALLGIGVDARKKHKKKHTQKQQHKKPVSAPPAAAVFDKSTPAAVAATVSAAAHAPADEPARQFVQQFEAQKAQLQHIVEHHTTENKKLVDQHNKLVTDYNVLLHSHMELIKKYNVLIGELQDPSTRTFLAAKTIQAINHPGVQGAVNKTYLHVLPVAQELLMQGQFKGGAWFNDTHVKVQNFLQAYGGESSQDWAPTASGFIVYGSVLLPLALACWCVLEVVCRLRTLVLFGHVYLAAVFFALAVFAAATGDDPLTTFAEQDSKLYQFTQACFALLFVLYGAVSCTALCCSGKDLTWRCTHVVVLLVFGCVYYTLVWTPAMVDELPKVDDFVDSIFSPAEPVVAGKPAVDGSDQTVLLTTAPYFVVAAVFASLFVIDTAAPPEAAEEKDEEKAK